MYIISHGDSNLPRSFLSVRLTLSPCFCNILAPLLPHNLLSVSASLTLLFLRKVCLTFLWICSFFRYIFVICSVRYINWLTVGFGRTLTLLCHSSFVQLYTLNQCSETRSQQHQWRRHGVDCGGHVHPTFATGRSWNWYKSDEFLQGGGADGGSVRLRFGLDSPVGSMRSALAISVHPTYFDLATPMNNILTRAFQFAIRIDSIRFGMRIDSFCKKSAFRFTSCHAVFALNK